MKINLFLLSLLLLSMVSSCAEAQKPGADPKILIVYLSRTNNTKVIAEIIKKNVGGTLVAIELEKPYPKDYKATVQQVAAENEPDYLPPLKTRIEHIAAYDIVFVGFPTWGMKLPPPVKSFLSGHDLKGKMVIPFNTHGGYGKGSTFQTVKELCKNSNVPEGFSMEGGLERDGKYLVIQGQNAKVTETNVRAWLARINMYPMVKTPNAEVSVN